MTNIPTLDRALAGFLGWKHALTSPPLKRYAVLAWDQESRLPCPELESLFIDGLRSDRADPQIPAEGFSNRLVNEGRLLNKLVIHESKRVPWLLFPTVDRLVMLETSTVCNYDTHWVLKRSVVMRYFERPSKAPLKTIGFQMPVVGETNALERIGNQLLGYLIRIT